MIKKKIINPDIIRLYKAILKYKCCVDRIEHGTKFYYIFINSRALYKSTPNGVVLVHPRMDRDMHNLHKEPIILGSIFD